MPGGLMSLDLATALGYAVGRIPVRPPLPIEAAVLRPPQPVSGVHRVAPPGTAVGPFLHAFRLWAEAIFDEHQPAGVIFESPILPKKTNPATVRKLVGLAGITQMLAHERGIRWVREGQPSSVKLHICGDGGPGKNGVQRAILARGWTFADDNEADALALWDYGAHVMYRERAAA